MPASWVDPQPIPISTDPNRPDEWGATRNGHIAELTERTNELRSQGDLADFSSVVNWHGFASLGTFVDPWRSLVLPVNLTGNTTLTLPDAGIADKAFTVSLWLFASTSTRTLTVQGGLASEGLKAVPVTKSRGSCLVDLRWMGTIWIMTVSGVNLS